MARQPISRKPENKTISKAKKKATGNDPSNILGCLSMSPDIYKPKVTKEKSTDLYTLAHTYKCCACGDSSDTQRGMFSQAYSKNYAGINYYLPICTSCLDIMWENLYAQLQDKEQTFRRICMMFDVYYSIRLATDALSSAKPQQNMTAYLKLSTVRPYANKTFADTLVEEADADDSIKVENVSLKTQCKTLEDKLTTLKTEKALLKSDVEAGKALVKELQEQLKTKESIIAELSTKRVVDENDELYVDQSVVDFWGEGFEPKDYKYLQAKYDTWVAKHECKTHAQVVLFQQICMLEWRIWLANTGDRGENVSNLIQKLNDLLKTADVTPNKTQENVFADTQSFGTLIEKFEKTRPIPESEPSGLAKYVCVWFFGHLCKLIGIKNHWAEMYDEEVSKYTVQPPQFEDDDVVNAPSFEDVFGDAQ